MPDTPPVPAELYHPGQILACRIHDNGRSCHAVVQSLGSRFLLVWLPDGPESEVIILEEYASVVIAMSDLFAVGPDGRGFPDA